LTNFGFGFGCLERQRRKRLALCLNVFAVRPSIGKTLANDALGRNLGDGRFEELIEEAGSGVAAAHASRGAAFGDFDNDGDIDVLIMNMNEPPSLLRNDVSGGRHWLKVQLVGVQSNRSAIGSRVTARYGNRRQAQEVASQASFYSCNDRRLHFGLGAETSADLTVRWTNGATQTFPAVGADQLVTIREDSGIIRKQRFR